MFTIDTEVWPYRDMWREEGLVEDIRRDVYGITNEGEFGIDFQCQMLQDHGMKAVFFVESLFATVFGIAPLRNIVDSIRKYKGQDVELHAHPEWTKYFEGQYPLAGENYHHFHQFSLEKQISLLDLACKNLQAAGVNKILGFRAGNYGANLDTCRAVKAIGIPFEFSYNPGIPYCKIEREGQLLTQPTALCGVTEYPTSFFKDYPGHIRHAQICACSFLEMQYALNQSWEKGWKYFVILSHSNELIRDRKQPNLKPRVNQIILRRMEKLCTFIKMENDRFSTITCQNIDPLLEDTLAEKGQELRGRLSNTIARYGLQAWNRLT